MLKIFAYFSVADPDPGSDAFFYLWIRRFRMEKNTESGSGKNIHF
jgi:hypothetical protein